MKIDETKTRTATKTAHNNLELKKRAEFIAVAALQYLAEDAERLGRFLALTGLAPGEIRQAAKNPDFLAAILQHLASDESLLLAFAHDKALKPEEIARAIHYAEHGA